MSKKEIDPGMELDEKKWQLEFHNDIPPGCKSYPPVIRDKKPVKVLLQKGKKYEYCTCGFSGTQVKKFIMN